MLFFKQRVSFFSYIACYIFLGLGSISLLSCHNKPKEIPVQIERLEQPLFTAKSPSEVQAIIQKTPLLKFYLGNYVQDSAFVQQLFANVSNQQLQQFNQELQQQFGDMATIKAQLSEAFSNIQQDFPTFKMPRVATAVTGFMANDLYVSDSVIVIGLDYFGGPKAKYRPQVYDYQLRRYQAAYIVPSILFLLSERYNKSDKNDQTLLADMVWYGKGFEFVKRTLPNTPDSLIIGYSQQQLDDVYASQEDIWAYFLDRKLLYQTRDAEKERFIGERPATVEVSQYAPGGIARWVGWRMVSQYMQQNEGVTLPQLMANQNAKQIFEQSKYRGQKDNE